MNKIVCFKIENQILYLEKVLAEFDIPTFFMCIDEKNERYAVLCTDLEELTYIVAKIEISNLISMLKKKIYMHDLFTESSKKWRVLSGLDYNNDTIEETSFFENSELPEPNIHYNIQSKEITEYVISLKDEWIRKQYTSTCNSINVKQEAFKREKHLEYCMHINNFTRFLPSNQIQKWVNQLILNLSIKNLQLDISIASLLHEDKNVRNYIETSQNKAIRRVVHV